MFDLLTFNFKPTEIRTETMEGVEYTVVPMSMLTEGVFAGTDGPLMYTANQLAKTPAIWNGRPIVVYHPMLDGCAISAGDPMVFDKQKVGFVMNTHWNGQKLLAEAWIDAAKADKVDVRVMEAITNNQVMEVSTGVFTDKVHNPGTFDGKEFAYEATNFRPDHLALLPDQKGACSVADGAGLLVANALSHSNIHQQLQQTLREKMGDDVWVMDVYPDFVVYENGRDLERLPYTTEDTEVSLGTELPEKVVRVTEYRTATGAFVGNSSTREILKPVPEEDTMDKKKLVDGLIANASTQWAETDREFLEGLDAPQLEKMTPVANAQNDEEDPQPAKGNATKTSTQSPQGDSPEDNPTGNRENTPATQGGANRNPQPASLQEFLATAPTELRGPLNSIIANHNARHAELVESLVANERCAFSKEELTSRSIDELEKLASMVAPTSNGEGHDFIAGVGTSYLGQATPTGNSNGSGHSQKALDRPTMNFGTSDDE